MTSEAKLMISEKCFQCKVIFTLEEVVEILLIKASKWT